jgi:hypothetical protein
MPSQKSFSRSACQQLNPTSYIAAVNSFHNICCADLNLVNLANIVLIPKKDGAESILHFRPISLIQLQKSEQKIRGKTPALLMKLDSSKACDSVHTPGLFHRPTPTQRLTTLERMDCSNTSSCSKILLDGIPLRLIQHG